MIERRDTPAPFMQRRPPPPPLDLKPAIKHISHSDSPPRTPPYRIRTRGQRAAKAHANQPIPRETYLDGHKDGVYAREGSHARSGGEEHRNERISHDLSFSDNARHSVVDHMLLSLNPDQPKLFSTPPETRPFSSSSRFTSPLGSHRRGHTHSSSLNTDYAYISDESSGQLTRGRCSNSSSNFQSALARINSLQGGENNSREALYETQRAATRENRPTLRKGRKVSKGSGSSSVDFGRFMRQPQYWQSSHTRRSSSLDPSYRNAYRFPLQLATNPPISHAASDNIDYDDLEAAPTPTVPVGPRSRDRSPAFPSPPPHAPPQAPSLQRKISINSTKGYSTRRNKVGVGGMGNRDYPGNEFTKPRRGSQQANPMLRHSNSRNASPARHHQDMPVLSRQVSGPQAKDPPKERQGFFRRVFGSSRNISLPAAEPRSTHVDSSRESIRGESRNGFASLHKLSKQPPHGVTVSPAKENIPPALVKKPSYFFRRRKKSVSGQNLTPLLPLHLQPNFKPASSNSTGQERASSPVSSLREVMNPFLNTPGLSATNRDGPQASAIGRNGTVLATSNSAQDSLTIHPEPALGDNVDVVSLSERKHSNSITRECPRSKSKFVAVAIPDPLQLRSQAQNSLLRDDSTAENRRARSHLATSGPLPTGNSVEAAYADSKFRSVPTPKPLYPFQSQNLEDIKHIELQPRLARDGSISPSTPTSANLSKQVDGQDWLPLARPTAGRKAFALPNSSSKSRVYLKPIKSPDGQGGMAESDQPPEAEQVSPVSEYHSASSTLRITQENDSNSGPETPTGIVTNEPSPDSDPTVPTADDRIQAKKIYNGDGSFLINAKAAAWLGEADADRTRVRRAYMELFDWQNLNILAALRDFCSRLLLKGETQQVDRILDAFSSRWCACNPNHGFKATGTSFMRLMNSADSGTDVVHTISYSLLLLNTDLYMADIEQKMTRAQFIKNTMPTIRRVAADAAPDGFENPRSATLTVTKHWVGPSSERNQSPATSDAPRGRCSFEPGPTCRLSTRPSEYSGCSGPPTPLDYETPTDDCGPLVKAPFRGKMSTWELQIEIVLKDFFSSIRLQRLPLHGNENKENVQEPPMTFNSLSTMTGNMLRRTPSMLSRAGSENFSYRGRPLENRLGTGRWTSKTRSRPRIYPASTVASNRTSLEDQSSMWSPSVSSTWSKYSIGKTPTSLSMDSFASDFPQADYQKSIGFANALSQAIIREESANADTAEESLRPGPLLDDESLELAGAPWAKEGILKHKHHLESMDKKAKDRNWVESFAVIEKGWMRLFSFNLNTKSMRLKARNQKLPGGVVGGGNWMDSAEPLGKFLLRQTIASALPPPGYSKSRPHVWALSLPTGAVHLFQVGTPEIIKEFVTTANYWSARLSKEPLVGGVSNIEYGWSDAIINAALFHTENNPITTPATSGPRPSLQSSIRSSVDQGSFRARLPGDKIAISDWTYPPQSMMASVLLEVDQLRALTTYVKNIEEELQKHNQLRGAMALAVNFL